MLTHEQATTAQAIVNIFETGKIRGDYAKVTLAAGDRGHVSYGRSQASLSSGNLYTLLQNYSEAGGRYAAEIVAYLPRLHRGDIGLDEDRPFHALLVRAGSDPVMRAVQDAFFEARFWLPACRRATMIGVCTALGTTVCYDSQVHGSFDLMYGRTVSLFGVLATLGEQEWCTHYLQVRRNWLAAHTNRVLRRTVYRMDALLGLASAANWELTLPFTMRGVSVTESILSVAQTPVAAVRWQGLLKHGARGAEVRRLQQLLGLRVDGIFGAQTKTAVVAYQERVGLPADGIFGPATAQKLQF